MPNTRVVVSYDDGTERSLYLDTFRQNRPDHSAKLIRISGQQPEGSLQRLITIEFGQQTNWLMAQSQDEAWALGVREQLRSMVRRYERNYALTTRRFGLGLNQLILGGAVVSLPSAPNTLVRAIILLSAYGIVQASWFANRKALPNAAIHLGRTEGKKWNAVARQSLSWVIAATASIVAGLVVWFLTGGLQE